MLRNFLRFLLLLAVIHHGVALPGTWQAGVASGDLSQHALMHWLGQAHHHHDDGGLHKHGGAESAQHLQIDNVMQAPVLMGAAAAPLGAEARPVRPESRVELPPKTTFLALPERPPRRCC